MSIATLTHAGRAAFALSLSKQPLHVALAQGEPAWDNEDAELPNTVELTALTNEMGRRVPNIVGFVTPDDEGGIVISEGLGSDGAVVTTRYRMVTGPTHTNVIFDAVVPYGCKMSDREAEEKIKKAVHELDPSYFAVVQIDKSYVR